MLLPIEVNNGVLRRSLLVWADSGNTAVDKEPQGHVVDHVDISLDMQDVSQLISIGGSLSTPVIWKTFYVENMDLKTEFFPQVMPV